MYPESPGERSETSVFSLPLSEQQPFCANRKELAILQPHDLLRLLGAILNICFPLWLCCGSLLKDKSVKYRTLPEGALPQAPSGRLRPGAFVFPGSKSPLNHVLFLSPLDDHRVMVVGYSKNLVFPGSEINELEVTADELNEANSVGLWKVERKNGNCFPVLEVIAGPVGWESGLSAGREERAKEFLWKCCGTIDTEFKTSGNFFLKANALESKGAAKLVKDFLEKTGFKKIKESPIPRGVSYLVVLSNDDEEESSPWKRFPMKIDVTELITIRIYFSLNDSAVNAAKRFIHTSKRLIATVNTMFPVGFYNYSSGTNQLQYTLKLNHQCLSPADLRTSLKEYYDSAILGYKWTVRAFAALYEKRSAVDSESEVFSVTEQLGTELKGDNSWKKLEIKDLTGDYVQLLRKMEASPELADAFLPRPFYSLSKSEQVYVKTCRSRLSLRDFLDRFETRSDMLSQSLYDLLLKLLIVGVFPTVDMLFCTCTAPLQLTIIPDAGLHQDAQRCVTDFGEFILSRLTSLALESTWGCKDSGMLYIKAEAFEESRVAVVDEFTVIRSSLASEECILYPLNQSATSLRFRLLLQLYMSKLEELPEYHNKVIGYTEFTDFDSVCVEFEEDCLFLCEKYYFQIYNFNDPFISMLSFLDEVEKLHSSGFFHWFICPLTLREVFIKPEQRSRRRLVLPCLQPKYAEMLYACLEQPSKDYLAPEVVKYLQTGKIVDNPFAADIYSLCKCLLAKIQFSKSVIVKGSEEDSALITLERGLDTKPESRPGIEKVREAIEVLGRFQNDKKGV